LLSERQGDNKGAAEAAQKVLDIGQRLKSAEAQGYAHDLFGVIEHNAGRFDRAKVAFGRARDYFSKAGTQVELARATANLARVHYAAQEYDAATKFYEVALSLDSAAQNERGQAADYLGLAEVQLVKGETDKAIGNLQRTLSISEKFEDRHVQSKALSVLGRAYQNRHQPGDLDKAKEAALRALKIKQDNNNPLGIAYEYGNLGRLALAKKDYDEAEKYYLEAIKLSKNRSRFAEAVNQRGLGRIYFEWKKFTLAVDAFRSALEIDRDLPHKADAALQGRGCRCRRSRGAKGNGRRQMPDLAGSGMAQ
jgi:tetratricopeptide (TPR) repeat protein